MPMSESTMKAFFLTKLQDVYGDAKDAAERDKFATVLAITATYIQQNAIVPFPIAVTVVGGPVTQSGGTTAPGAIT